MAIVALGLNHTTAPLELRERAVVDDAGMSSALRSLSRFPGVSEAAILSTCNRTDLYCGVGAGQDAPARWFGEFLGIDRGDLAGHLYVHREDAAVRHVMRVASGLDSMVLGEPQILGQLKQAYGLARREGSLGVVLDKLFQRSFSVAKRVRTDTDIGASPVSVAYAAVTLAHRIFGEFDARTALLVGAGQEWYQSFLPHRSADPNDILFDAVGAVGGLLFGTIVATLWQRRLQRQLAAF